MSLKQQYEDYIARLRLAAPRSRITNARTAAP